MTPWDTIVAPTTPYGHSGVANIRISGSDALNILSKLSGGQVFSNRCATLSSLRGFDKAGVGPRDTGNNFGDQGLIPVKMLWKYHPMEPPLLLMPL